MIIMIDKEIYNVRIKGLNTPVGLKHFFSLGTMENELAVTDEAKRRHIWNYNNGYYYQK